VIGFTNDLEANGVDGRYALVSFKDDNEVDQSLTDDVAGFKSAVDAMSARGGNDGPEDSFDAIATGLDLDYRADAEKVVVHVTDAPGHEMGRSSNTVADLRSELDSRDVTFYTVSPKRGYYTTGESCYGPEETGSWDYIDLAEDTGGVRLNNCDERGFDPFIEEILDDLTDRYQVTYRSCLPADGRGRNVGLYVDSEGTIGEGTTDYTAPTGGSSGDCYTPPPASPDPDAPLSRTLTTDVPTPDLPADPVRPAPVPAVDYVLDVRFTEVTVDGDGD
jgi:hypothetical protein